MGDVDVTLKMQFQSYFIGKSLRFIVLFILFNYPGVFPSVA